MTASLATYSDQNEKYKPCNQDATVTAVFRNEADALVRLIAVADGISSSYQGEKAACEAVKALVYALENSNLKSAKELCSVVEDQFFEPINKKLLSIQGGGKCSQTTFTAVVVFEEDSAIFHLGDTRAFLVDKRGRYCVCLTEDHNPYDGKARQTQGAVVSRYLGAHKDQWVPDVILNHPEMTSNRDAIIVVTCDGVHDFISDRHILGLINQNKADLSRFCVGAVNAAKGMWSPRGNPNTDNISIASQALDWVPKDEELPVIQYAGSALQPNQDEGALLNSIEEKLENTDPQAPEVIDESVVIVEPDNEPPKLPKWFWWAVGGINLMGLFTIVLVLFVGLRTGTTNEPSAGEITGIKDNAANSIAIAWGDLPSGTEYELWAGDVGPNKLVAGETSTLELQGVDFSEITFDVFGPLPEKDPVSVRVEGEVLRIGVSAQENRVLVSEKETMDPPSDTSLIEVVIKWDHLPAINSSSYFGRLEFHLQNGLTKSVFRPENIKLSKSDWEKLGKASIKFYHGDKKKWYALPYDKDEEQHGVIFLKWIGKRDGDRLPILTLPDKTRWQEINSGSDPKDLQITSSEEASTEGGGE